MVSLSSASLAVLAKADTYKANTSKAVTATQAKAVPVKAITNKINTVQTGLSSIGLGEKTLAAQKALAEKWGITTFDVKGNISQVPTTRSIDPKINVGTGILTNSAYNDSVALLVQQEQAKISSVGNSNNNPIITGITDFIDSFFHIDKTSEIPDELKAQIKEIDDQITTLSNERDAGVADYTKRAMLPEGRTELNTILEREGFRETYRLKIEALNKQKARLLLDFKTKIEFLPKVQSLIDSLKLYGNIEVLTPQLKTEIQDRIAQGSALLEKIISENLNITRAKVSELQQAMILAANVMELPITSIQTTVKGNMDGTAEVIDVFNLLNPAKTASDRVKEIIASYRDQKEAIKILLQTGEFSS